MKRSADEDWFCSQCWAKESTINRIATPHTCLTPQSTRDALTTYLDELQTDLAQQMAISPEHFYQCLAAYLDERSPRPSKQARLALKGRADDLSSSTISSSEEEEEEDEEEEEEEEDSESEE
jgi:hypothetical protein